MRVWSCSMKNKPIARILIPAAFILCGAAFLAVGIFHGEAEIVFQKATRICLECIGIG